MTQIIDGKKSAAAVKEEVRIGCEARSRQGKTVGLAVVLVGSDPASQTYVRAKRKDCADCKITSFDYDLAADTSEDELLSLIDELNDRPEIHGILVQLPLPRHIDEEKVLARISPAKDVDGFSAVSMGRLARGLDTLRACTPFGVMRLLEDYGIDLEGKHAVVIGRSNIVGKPQALMLLEKNATVTICHSRTPNLPEVCKRADVLVAAVGRAGFVTPSFIKPGAVVIDVGINRNEEGKLVGDVDFDAVLPLCSAITPVPGGVGPMTRAMLMKNVYLAAEALDKRA